MDIGVWGDSITYGSCDEEALGWVGRLRRTRSAELDHEATYERGVCGDTSAGLLARFEEEFDSLIYGLDIVVFAIGLNDSARKGVEGEYIVPLEEFTKNMEQVIAQAKVKASKVYVIGTTNVDESRTAPLPGSSSGKVFLNENAKKYNQALREASKSLAVPFIEVFGILKNTDLADGLHPNGQGYEKLFSVISESIK